MRSEGGFHKGYYCIMPPRSTDTILFDSSVGLRYIVDAKPGLLLHNQKKGSDEVRT